MDLKDKNHEIVAIIKKALSERKTRIAIYFVCVCVLLIVILTVSGAQGKVEVDSSRIDDTEDKLCNVLSKIKGAGKVSVMITYSGGSEQVIAYETDSKTDLTREDGLTKEYTTENKTPVLISKNGVSTPVVLKEVRPEIVGVIVVAEGGGNIKVKLDLINAVKTVLNISAQKIEIFTMK